MVDDSRMLSLNPHVCASCLSVVDGLDDAGEVAAVQAIVTEALRQKRARSGAAKGGRALTDPPSIVVSKGSSR